MKLAIAAVRFQLIILFLLVGLFCAAPASAQAQPQPEELGVIYYMSPVQKGLVPLVKETIVVKSSQRFLGYAGSTTRAEVRGEQSSLQLPAGQVHEFFVRGINPTEVNLFRFEVKDDRREVRISSSGALGLRGKSELDKSEVPISVTECGGFCYRFVPNDALGLGEYGFSRGSMDETFSFGIVPATDFVEPPPVESSPTEPEILTNEDVTSINDDVPYLTRNRAAESDPREPEILTNEDVITLKLAGLGDELIIAKVKSTPGNYRLQTEDIVALKNQGVAEAIILAMIEAAQNR